MKNKRSQSLLALLASLILAVTSHPETAAANWYVGSYSLTAHGVSADISTPAVPPYMEPVPSSQQYHWVSTISDSWIQTGWSYGVNYPTPLSYIEFCIVHCTLVPRYFVEFDPHLFGQIRNYRVEDISGTVWCAYVNGQQIECRAVIDAPAPVAVSSEVIASSKNEINTSFLNVQYKDYANAWHLFDPILPISTQCPYLGSGNSSSFRSFRGSCVYVPAISQSHPIINNGDLP